MLQVKTPKDLAQESHTLAKSFNLVRYRNITYMPVDFELMKATDALEPERTVWVPLPREELRLVAHEQFGTLFKSDGELASFDFMVMQNSELVKEEQSSILVRTTKGLKELAKDGTLVDPSGSFVPNFLQPMLNEDPDTKAEVLATITEWVDGAEEAESLLHHLATSLAPGWSAVKYVLLLGEGRNGKGTLLKMLKKLFGQENISHVTRHSMAENNPVVTELNGKLLNLIFDGPADFLKDSGTEKSLIAGEPVPIRRLYESTATMVQTNALFVEALNREPKSKDKSPALQKRLVRFQFPNVYPLDHKFEKYMLSGEIVGAFLSLLIDHYVTDEEIAKKLAPTGKAVELQLEHMFTNSLALQFLKYVELHDAFGVDGLADVLMEDVVVKFRAWRLHENDVGQWAEPDVVNLLSPVFFTERVSKRVDGKPRKVRVVKGLRPEATMFIKTLKEEADAGDADLLEAVVDG